MQKVAKNDKNNKTKQIQQIKLILNKSLIVLNEFEWLLDALVLDFYVEDHWNLLPLSWTQTFEQIQPRNLANVFGSDKQQNEKASYLFPLSFLALRVLLRDLCISRDSSQNSLKSLQPSLYYSHPKLSKLFRRQVKLKKQHEIDEMSKICSKMADECNVNYIIDFGSGLGHLSRILCYGYGLKVCCFEQQSQLTTQASIIDNNIQNAAHKYQILENNQIFDQPVHLNMTLTEKTSVEELLMAIKKAFQLTESDEIKFGIVGLHPCGNLAAILLKIFFDCPQAKFLNLVGCCYMKLTCEKTKFIGYPLSSYLSKHSLSHLSYGSREIACHANEIYFKQLHNGNYNNLKIHSYRATLEKIILKNWPTLKHSGLKSVKYNGNLTFSEYCDKAIQNLNIKISDDDIHSKEVENYLCEWQKIVFFHTMRWILAPLIESTLLYDRLLCILENGFDAEINAVFDPLISPRNHILTGKK